METEELEKPLGRIGKASMIFFRILVAVGFLVAIACIIGKIQR
ncbi:MAG TPA: hypothetical protein VL576_03410 [Candidatus Paceibacterota bacterium]|jgi:hypothetical protein|nr:hypothetical protein [Candidatus Paceibacterota bacterium]